MATLTVSRTVSAPAALVRRTVIGRISQPHTRQPQPAARPSFLVVLLRALGGMAS